jgi:hypothetical protein
MVPVFPAAAVIVQPTAFVTGLASNCTGVPAVVTVVVPWPPEKAMEVRKINRQISQRGRLGKGRWVMVLIIKQLTPPEKYFCIRLVLFPVFWYSAF